MYSITSTFTATYGGKRYQSAIEYADDEDMALQRMRDWAALHGATERLSIDGRYFDKTDGTTFFMERVDTEPAQ